MLSLEQNTRNVAWFNFKKLFSSSSYFFVQNVTLSSVFLVMIQKIISVDYLLFLDKFLSFPKNHHHDV